MKFNFKEFLKVQTNLPYWKNIENLLNQKDLVPSRNLVFECFNNLDFNNLKLVIIGQDPYPSLKNADGLCFSSNNKKTPKSLANIFAEIKNCYPNSIFSSNSLQDWKKQGILLLNYILTTKEGFSLAHKNIGWEIFNTNLLKTLLESNNEILFLAMGKQAQNFIKDLNIKNDLVFCTAHPSPLSSKKGFFHSFVFKKINDKLISLSKEPIDWNTY
ncbi:Uracil-DNA glycosylase [Metamycoplasma auris 15026]|uniref:uracil-DNA glycosylase n=1 Tax=Metamycoplasma auris 15026 TaxID=1188233 RepID=N9VC13_9BACT|nr:uracil-DNA glycosylase [Metamycoplasma auris]ENY69193.1 Uracil-DNA glycosylase [Metamycoplasma auris 15026]